MSCAHRNPPLAHPGARDLSPRLGPVVESLCHANGGLLRTRNLAPCRRVLPSRSAISEVVESLRSVLFPGYFGISEITEETMAFHLGATLDRIVGELREQVERGLAFLCSEDPGACLRCDLRSHEVVRAFVERLPEVRRLLALDVLAAFEGDPAATSPDEAVFCYPGILAVTNHRLAHELYRLGVPIIPRILSELAHSATGIDIHPGASIGERFFIDHGTGVVIGETAVIGQNVRLYQGVTLGARSFPKDENGNPIKGVPRHPIVEDDVVIYAGATVLGRVTIGRGTVIGGNVWVTRSLPPFSTVSQATAREDRYEEGAGI